MKLFLLKGKESVIFLRKKRDFEFFDNFKHKMVFSYAYPNIALKIFYGELEFLRGKVPLPAVYFSPDYSDYLNWLEPKLV